MDKTQFIRLKGIHIFSDFITVLKQRGRVASEHDWNLRQWKDKRVIYVGVVSEVVNFVPKGQPAVGHSINDTLVCLIKGLTESGEEMETYRVVFTGDIVKKLVNSKGGSSSHFAAARISKGDLVAVMEPYKMKYNAALRLSCFVVGPERSAVWMCTSLKMPFINKSRVALDDSQRTVLLINNQQNQGITKSATIIEKTKTPASIHSDDFCTREQPECSHHSQGHSSKVVDPVCHCQSSLSCANRGNRDCVLQSRSCCGSACRDAHNWSDHTHQLCICPTHQHTCHHQPSVYRSTVDHPVCNTSHFRVPPSVPCSSSSVKYLPQCQPTQKTGSVCTNKATDKLSISQNKYLQAESNVNDCLGDSCDTLNSFKEKVVDFMQCIEKFTRKVSTQILPIPSSSTPKKSHLYQRGPDPMPDDTLLTETNEEEGSRKSSNDFATQNSPPQRVFIKPAPRPARVNQKRMCKLFSINQNQSDAFIDTENIRELNDPLLSKDSSTTQSNQGGKIFSKKQPRYLLADRTDKTGCSSQMATGSRTTLNNELEGEVRPYGEGVNEKQKNKSHKSKLDNKDGTPLEPRVVVQPESIYNNNIQITTENIPAQVFHNLEGSKLVESSPGTINSSDLHPKSSNSPCISEPRGTSRLNEVNTNEQREITFAEKPQKDKDSQIMEQTQMHSQHKHSTDCQQLSKGVGITPSKKEQSKSPKVSSQLKRIHLPKLPKSHLELDVNPSTSENLYSERNLLEDAVDCKKLENISVKSQKEAMSDRKCASPLATDDRPIILSHEDDDEQNMGPPNTVDQNELTFDKPEAPKNVKRKRKAPSVRRVKGVGVSKNMYIKKKKIRDNKCLKTSNSELKFTCQPCNSSMTLCSSLNQTVNTQEVTVHNVNFRDSAEENFKVGIHSEEIPKVTESSPAVSPIVVSKPDSKDCLTICESTYEWAEKDQQSKSHNTYTCTEGPNSFEDLMTVNLPVILSMIKRNAKFVLDVLIHSYKPSYSEATMFDLVSGHCSNCQKIIPFSRLIRSDESTLQKFCPVCYKEGAKLETHLIYFFTFAVVDSMENTHDIIVTEDEALDIIGISLEEFLSAAASVIRECWKRVDSVLSGKDAVDKVVRSKLVVSVAPIDSKVVTFLSCKLSCVIK